jgi:hypothetical protein
MEFNAAVEGYLEGQTDYAKVIRFASFRVAESFAGSKAIGSISRFWPMPDDEEKSKEEELRNMMTPERVREIMERHNIKKSK